MKNKNIKIELPQDVKLIINILENNNFSAYAVGGCIRDSLLGRKPKDYDITTNALPIDVIKIFKELGCQVIPTGLKHGTITILINKTPYEITTFRIDGEYSDNRHPDNVQFTTLLKDDLSRRDFTINSMAYNDTEGLIDYFGGINDLNNKIIRCVGDSNDRFNEDALRMLRACRFSAQLGFEIEEKTFLAIICNDELIKNVSKERVQSELNKILLSDHPDYISQLYIYEILDDILPEYADCFECTQINPYHVYNVGTHIKESIKQIETKLSLRLAMLFHDIAKPQCKITDEQGIDHFYGHAEESSKIAEIILRRLKYDNTTIDKVTTLIKYHDIEITSNKQIRKLLNKIGEENLRDLLKVKEADIKAQNPDFYEDRHNHLLEVENKINEIVEQQQCFSLKDLDINGHDLIKLGYKGKEIGYLLNGLLEQVLDNPELNSKDELLKLLSED
ncbi:CCA tRNA nucleotidyltransferase [Clostridium sp.]|jgi:tRNA nucleotidyltransferase (CCA-adding enzyme)|uniref:CCA tRNA nucleotidyltransferase n=1 Tax=Clostridium sp. TaxID=1506 RepID=UPI00258C895A|nr:CCA tRNA nucleotidyltransferase [Clostridium sp.]MDF2505875.1 pcnB [Clostridium sp.]